MSDVLMPRLSDSMEEAVIVTWLVADGDEVKVGQEIAEIETDKATVSLESEAAGTIQLVAQIGDTVPLGGLVARILVPGEAEPSPSPKPSLTANGGAAPLLVTQTATELATTHTEGRIRGHRRPLASPLARRIASLHGIDLAAITGTGPRGRIVKADLAAHVTSPSRPITEPLVASEPVIAPQPAVSLEPAVPEPIANGRRVTTNGSRQTLELSRTQALIARRMSQSRATVPDFDVSIEVDMEDAWELRARLKADGADPVPSLNDIIVMACGRALSEHPNVNSAYKDGQVERYDRVNVGIAIATEDSLIVATLPDADRLHLGEIARTSRQLASKVRDGSISPAELSGATFTVSNLGMFGVDSFTAVLNPPQAAILAVGSVKARAVARAGEIVCRRTASFTLAADHRLLYGADAARFLARVAGLLEQPLKLIMG
jgi:pyruvate dehydrogenase E2 component (dihydrolipoamide acetyltransferase)